MTRDRSPLRIAEIVAILASAACAGTLADPGRFTDAAGADAAPGTCPDVPTVTLAKNCALSGCHDAATKTEGLDLQSPNVASRLVGVAATEGAGLLIDPKMPPQSVLYRKLTPTPPFGLQMPPTMHLDDATVQCVLAWITSVAGTSPQTGTPDSGAPVVVDASMAPDAQDAPSVPTFATIRIAAGQTSAVTDAQQDVWSADQDFTGGTPDTSATQVPIAGTDTPALYNSQRYGNPSFTYQFSVPNGAYSVVLKFAELYVTGPGMREFDIAINGATVETNFDIYAAAGAMNAAVDKTFPVQVTGGMIQIAFTAGMIQSPKVDAISITVGSAADGGI